MSGGLVALLDDIAALARIAAASLDDVGAAASRASLKAAGVVVDDAAVTPQYVQGVAAQRELPIIKKIAIGSIKNKLFFILPAVLLLSQFIPWILIPILMLGGTYLCFEGAEKIYGKLAGHEKKQHVAAEVGPEEEGKLIKGAIRTDFILSAEIMVISLNEVANEPFVNRAIILIIVAIGITAVVYGAVALIVKMDDAGLALAQKDSPAAQKIGIGLVNAMPKVLTFITVIGTAAMLWVGGHILLVGVADLGWHAPYDLVHHVEEAAKNATGAIGGFAGWLTNTICSAIIGLIVGAVVVAIMHVLPFGKKHGHHDHEAAAVTTKDTNESGSNTPGTNTADDDLN